MVGTMPRTPKKDHRMLTPKEAKFVAEYMATSKLGYSAQHAGYPKSAGGGLLKRPAIARELNKRMGKLMAKKAITGEAVIEELGKIAFANIDDFVDGEFRIKAKPGRRKMAAVQNVTTETFIDRRKGVAEEDREDVKKVKLTMYSKLDALNALGRHFGLFKDKIEISGDLGERLERARKRLEEEGTET